MTVSELLGRGQLQFALDDADAGSFCVDFLEQGAAQDQRLVDMRQDLSLVTRWLHTLADLGQNSLDLVNFEFNLFALVHEVALELELPLLGIDVLIALAEGFLPLEVC